MRHSAQALAGVVEAGSTLAVHGGGALATRYGGPICWPDLVAWLQSTFEVTVSPQTVGRRQWAADIEPQTLSRELRALGYRKRQQA